MPRLSASRYSITVPAIGGALAPDDVVTRTPRSMNIEKIGLSTPADIEWSHRRFGAASATFMNGACQFRPGIAREERHGDALDVAGSHLLAGPQHDDLEVGCRVGDAVGVRVEECLGAEESHEAQSPRRR